MNRKLMHSKTNPPPLPIQFNPPQPNNHSHKPFATLSYIIEYSLPSPPCYHDSINLHCINSNHYRQQQQHRNKDSSIQLVSIILANITILA